MKRLNNKGFTLVELMVVIVIIGILAALAIPKFLGATSKAKAAEFKPVLKQIYTLQLAYNQEKDAYGTTMGAIGWDTPSGGTPRFAYTITGDATTFTGTATVEAGAGIKDATGDLVGLLATINQAATHGGSARLTDLASW